MSAVEDAKRQQALAARAKALGLSEATLEAAEAVPTKLVRDIVNDFRGGLAQPSSIAPKKPAQEPVARGSGWSRPLPVEQPPGIKYIDQMVDHQDALDLVEKLRRLKP